MNRVFNLAFKAGLCGFLALIVMGLLLGGAEQIQSPKKTGLILIVFQVGALLSALVWLLGTLVLWVEGWIFILQGWRARSWLVSLVLVLALVFFNVLTAYCFHFFRQGQQKDLALLSHQEA